MLSMEKNIPNNSKTLHVLNAEYFKFLNFEDIAIFSLMN